MAARLDTAPATPGSPAGDASGSMTWSDWYQLALLYRRMGWVCIPLDGNKKPVGRWRRLQTRKPTDRQLGRLFEFNPRVRGLGVLLGRASGRRGRGLAVRDYDSFAGYREWAHAHPDVAALCPTVRTRRGAHVYFWHAGRDVFLDAGPARLPFGPGDLRADAGHYAVLPPSAHPNGGTYRWLLNEPADEDDIPVVCPVAAGLVPSHIASRPRQAPHVRATTTLKRTTHRGASKPSCASAPLAPAIREAVLRSLPTGPRQRHRRLFDLAQQLKDISPGATNSFWAAAFSEWWRLASPVIKSKDRGASWREFADAQDRVRLPTSDTVPRRAIRPPEDAAQGQKKPNTSSVHSEHARLILDACRRLAQLSPNGVFFLSYRLAGEACGLRHVQAGKYLNALVKAGHLVRVKTAKPSATRRRATRYRLGRVATGE